MFTSAYHTRTDTKPGCTWSGQGFEILKN
jgi:hypothetical protein